MNAFVRFRAPVIAAAILAGGAWANAACAPGRLAGATPGPPRHVATATQSPPPTPSAPAVVTPTVVVGGNVAMTSPAPGAEVRSPLRVQGRARVFEGNLQVQVRDARGKIIGNGFTTAVPGAPGWGEFSYTVTFSVTGTQPGLIEAFSTSPKDGTVDNMVSVPVILLGN